MPRCAAVRTRSSQSSPRRARAPRPDSASGSAAEGERPANGGRPGRRRREARRDRSAAGVCDFAQHFVRRTSTPLSLDAAEGERRLRIRLFMDTCSVEVFGSNGRATISSSVS
ncbi:GH32 C-terminal domain-containing protein [Streptomyces sp. NBC_01637]|uniref:GH32 C-terminal domain-containing protein n=1 Tax=unclassified Streptomyces TaxID=2593676 RepID=UPI00386E2249|nr:GH32 C-terminal domain-containing protein [Streptomyces sp. NBC_01653]